MNYSIYLNIHKDCLYHIYKEPRFFFIVWEQRLSRTYSIQVIMRNL